MSSPAPQATPAAAPASAPGRMLQLRLESKPIIYMSYMSFLEYGGVFLPSNGFCRLTTNSQWAKKCCWYWNWLALRVPINCSSNPMYAGLTPIPARAVAPKASAWHLVRTIRA